MVFCLKKIQDPTPATMGQTKIRMIVKRNLQPEVKLAWGSLLCVSYSINHERNGQIKFHLNWEMKTGAKLPFSRFGFW